MDSSDLLNKINHAEVTFKNGESFVGNLKIEAQVDVLGNWKISWSGLSGNYRYATGETFEGVWQPISISWENNKPSISIPTRGVMTFKDGKSVKGNWLAGFAFESSEWAEIFNGNWGPTDIRDKAIALKAKKEAELREKQRKEAEKRAKEHRKRYLINKYGKTIGTLLIEREVRIGMTEALVNEIWNRQVYDITRTVSYGKEMKTWTLNDDKLEQYIAVNGDEILMPTYRIVVIQSLAAFRVRLEDIPRKLVFIDGRLDDISMY